MSSIPLSFHSITYRRVKWKQRGGRFQKVFDRDSLFRSVYCLNLDAIAAESNRDYPWGQLSRISENEGEKKVEEEEERQKEKFERTSIERSVFDVARE